MGQDRDLAILPRLKLTSSRKSHSPTFPTCSASGGGKGLRWPVGMASGAADIHNPLNPWVTATCGGHVRSSMP